MSVFIDLHTFLLKADRLSTLSLQYEKRIDVEQRGGKRKIKLVQEQVNVTVHDIHKLHKLKLALLALSPFCLFQYRYAKGA